MPELRWGRRADNEKINPTFWPFILLNHLIKVAGLVTVLIAGGGGGGGGACLVPEIMSCLEALWYQKWYFSHILYCIKIPRKSNSPHYRINFMYGRSTAA